MFRVLKSLYDTVGRTTDGVPGSVLVPRGNFAIADESVFSTNAVGRLKTWPTDRDSHAGAHRIGDVVLKLDDISLAFGGVKALTDISFDVREHEIRAIIGPNGAGKSSMLNVINGVYRPQHGTITLSRPVAARHGYARGARRRASHARSRTSRCSGHDACSTTS